MESEQKLPPLEIDADDRLNSEIRQYSMGCDFENRAERDAVEAMICRERQLLSTLERAEKAEALNAEHIKRIGELEAALTEVKFHLYTKQDVDRVR